MDQHPPPGQPDLTRGHLDLGDLEAERALLADLLASSRLHHTGKDYLAYRVGKRRGVISKSESYLADYAKANDTVGSFDFYPLTKAAG